MLITYHGHSEFYLECANGFCLLTDPYDDHVGYPMGTYRADAVTVTHGHGDHSYIQKASGAPAIIDSAGEWHPAPEVKITAIPSVHDDANGAKRGKNLIMKIEMEGLTLAHMGDQGAPLTREQITALGKIDVLMIPIGGFYTIDAAAARDMENPGKRRLAHFRRKRIPAAHERVRRRPPAPFARDQRRSERAARPGADAVAGVIGMM